MTFMLDAYERRAKSHPDWTQPETSKDTFLSSSEAVLHKAGGPFRISVAGGPFGPARTLAEIAGILSRDLDAEPHGTKLVVACDVASRDQIADAKAFAFRRVGVDLKITNTMGSPAIDVIYSAVVAEFGSGPIGPVYSLGIYVNKPGEHGATCPECTPPWQGNAWDIGVLPTGDTPENRARYRAIRDWLIANSQVTKGKDGLPVGGVISQAQWWSPSSGGLQPYHSSTDLHWTHVHVSGAPEMVAGWI